MVDRLPLYTECLRKVAYPSDKVALKVSKRVFEKRGIELHCYYCPHCGKFHLTKYVREKLRQVF